MHSNENAAPGAKFNYATGAQGWRIVAKRLYANTVKLNPERARGDFCYLAVGNALTARRF
jgi:hypothetical protein